MSDPDFLRFIQSFLASPCEGRRASEEEAAAWEDFFQIHDRLIRSIVRRSDMSQSDLDDLAQEIWARLVRSLPKLELNPEVGTLHGWVTVVAAHHAERYNRRRTRRRHNVLTPELISTLSDPSMGPLASVEQEQDLAHMHAAITELARQMPERKGQIIREHWVNQQPISAIAADLNVSVEFVWTTLRRARPAILRCLRRAGFDIESEKNEKKLEIVDR